MKRTWMTAAAVTVCLTGGATAVAHYDHPAPSGSGPVAPLSSQINAGGENAEWELVGTIPTGNPHSDLDFFTHKGNTYASVGVLGTGPNGGGQTIVRLTEGDEVKPSFVSAHPSASCPTGSSSATGLQHDVEATPKGSGPVPQQSNPYLDTRDTQLLLDATDAPGRCHDQGNLGIAQGGNSPQGGIEVIDVTDPAKPKELALISHIGNAHTVNVDPKRPHIAFDVTQDGMAVDAEGKRANENPGGDQNDLDGFEVIDLSSCMNFAPGTTIEAKREKCRPQVFRYRYESASVSLAHSFRSVQSCHELEIYPDDRVTCASITATAVFDMLGAFDDNGTPADFTDDKPKGTPLPCKARPTSTASPAFKTGATIIDCVNGEVAGKPQPLNIPEWLKMGAPSLEGVRWVGTVPHMGFSATQDLVNSPYDATQDIVAAHESEMSHSGRFVFTSDERGGGIVPGGATCSPGADNKRGNGGLHAFPIASFTRTPPTNAEDAWKLWAKTSKGEKSIYRATPRTIPEGSFCTAHVFQQIPGQNRIFMGYYSQGTQVVDYVENADGTLDWKEAGWFTPENANTWTSHIFKVQENQDGTFTYWGATGDGIISGTGRGAIDVYKVTLPPPPKPFGGDPRGTPQYPRSGGRGSAGKKDTRPCARTSAFERVTVAPKGRGLAFSWSHRGRGAVTVDLFRQTKGRRILGERRTRAFGARTKGFQFKGRVPGGIYFARLRVKTDSGATDARRVALLRRGGRWRLRAPFDSRTTCGLVDSFKLTRPVFGGRGNAALFASFRLGDGAKVTIELRRGARLVRTIGQRAYAPNRTHRVRFPRFKGARGDYKVVLSASRPGRTQSITLTARKL
jgi:hypothetical protein